MRIRAVCFDVYETLLHVGPPPPDAAARWRWLWENSFGRKPRLEIGAFNAEVDAAIGREHERARQRGIAHPEILWPGILAEVAPEYRQLPRDARRGFELAQARLARTTALKPGAAPVIRLMLASGVVLGVASNAQPYTLWELDEALSAVGLGNDVFMEDVSFWSFRFGFSKPDPHVFRILTARIGARGISPSETLMVGDRADNDITPARDQGWMTFHLVGEGEQPDGTGGDWHTLAKWLDGRLES
ncbi:MAG: HAD family hydrolase [Verrucomicrobiales bacterium]|nr:HAD family hydrolase [Verrucomicrobiales bacterium]